MSNAELTDPYAQFTDAVIEMVMTVFPVAMIAIILLFGIKTFFLVVNDTRGNRSTASEEKPTFKATEQLSEKSEADKEEVVVASNQVSFAEGWTERVFPIEPITKKVSSVVRLMDELETSSTEFDTEPAHRFATLKSDFEQLLMTYERIAPKERGRFDEELVTGLVEIHTKLEAVQKTVEVDKEMAFSKQLLVIKER